MIQSRIVEGAEVLGAEVTHGSDFRSKKKDHIAGMDWAHTQTMDSTHNFDKEGNFRSLDWWAQEQINNKAAYEKLKVDIQVLRDEIHGHAGEKKEPKATTSFGPKQKHVFGLNDIDYFGPDESPFF